MARKPSYTKRDLTVACSKLKGFIIRKIESGDLEIKSITKNYIYNDLARRLELSSGSSLWKSNYIHKDYLDKWYSGLLESIESCKPATTSTPKQSGCTNNVIDTTANQVTEDDLRTIKELKSTIDTLNSIITNLRIENESLRMSRIHRVRRLDESPDILDESIDDVQLYKLYQAVSTLYKARFPDK